MSFDIWENILWGVLIVSFVGIFVSTAILIWGLVGEYKDPRSSAKIEIGGRSLKKFPLLVIIGVAGELLFNTTTFVSSITLDVLHSTEVAQANKIASAAYKVGNEAVERAETLALEVEILKAKNLEFEDKNQILQKNLDQSHADLLAALRTMTGDRDMNPADRDKLNSSLKNKRYGITLVMVELREPRRYGLIIRDALEDAGAVVKLEEEKTSRFTGVLVCEKNARDSALRKALNRAGIEAKSINQKTEDRPAFCDSPAGIAQPPPPRGLLGVATGVLDDLFSLQFKESRDRGTVIFVGEKVPHKVPER